MKIGTKLKKTALSNHLLRLIKAGIILKPDHNKYRLTSDGEFSIHALEAAYNKSETKEKKLLRRQFSNTFIKSFFGD